MTRAIFPVSCAFFFAMICTHCHAQFFGSSFQHRYGQANVFIYKTKEDSMQVIAIDKITEDELRRKPVRAKVMDSLTQVRLKIFQRGVRKKVFLPERDFINTDSINETTDLSSITKLSVYKKNHIPAVVWKCTNLKELELVNTTVNVIPAELNRLKSLTRLFINHNRSAGRLKLQSNSTVKLLSIRSEDPKLLPSTYKNFASLEHLDLSENGLVNFPNGARKNRKLKELNLQRNEITFAKRLKKHRYLETLSLHENKIRHVPSSIKNFQNLKKLNLNINSINSVDDAIGKLTHLEQISFYKNDLTVIPRGVYQLKELGQIDLFYNQIETIDAGFANWQKLHTLYLSYNKLTSLPENLDTLKNLTGLYVWDNRLGALPDCLSNMKGLQYLRINHNYIKKFPSGMEKLILLEELDISHNYFETLPDAIYEYPNLKIFAVVNNPWNEETYRTLLEKAAELVKRDVSVHLSEKN